MNLIIENKESKNLSDYSLEARNGENGVEEPLFPESELNGPKIRYGYQTGGMKYLIPDGAVSELVQNIKIYYLPNAPKWICGLVNIHGNVIPVVDIASLTGDEISHLNKSNILSVKNNDAIVGVLIDGLPEAISENDSEISNKSEINRLPGEINRFIKEGLKSNGSVWFDLDIFGLLKELALYHSGNNQG